METNKDSICKTSFLVAGKDKRGMFLRAAFEHPSD